MKMNLGAGAQTLLAMTVGPQLTRIVEMEKNVKTPHILHTFHFPTPPETVKEGYVTMNPEFAAAFRKACLENGVKNAGFVSFTMDSPKIISRDITLPAVQEKKIATMLMTNAGDYFPIDITQHKLVYSITEKGNVETGHQIRLTVYAIPHDLIRGYMRFARALNLEVQSLDVMGNSVVQAIRIVERDSGKDPSPHHVHLYISSGESSTVMTFRRGGVTELQRTVNFSFSDSLTVAKKLMPYFKAEEEAEAKLRAEKEAAAAVARIDSETEDRPGGLAAYAEAQRRAQSPMLSEDQPESEAAPETEDNGIDSEFDTLPDLEQPEEAPVLTEAEADAAADEPQAQVAPEPVIPIIAFPEDAFEMLSTRKVIYDSLDQVKRRSAASSDPRSLMTEAFRMLISQLKRNLDYYFEQQGDSELTVTAHLTDLAACVSGFDALLESELEIPVERLYFAGEKRYLIGQAIQPESPFATVPSVFGGVLAPLSIAEKQKKETIRLPVFLGELAVQRSVMAICGVICAVCVSLSVCLYFLPMGENAYLTNRYDKLGQEIAGLGNPKQYYDLYQKALALSKEVTGIEKATDTYNNHLVSFLEELETKMPKSFRAASFNVQQTGVNMSVQVGSKQEAIFVIQTLRGMASVKVEAISGLTETVIGGAPTPMDLDDLMNTNTYAAPEIDVQAYLDMALALGKITREEYNAYSNGNCSDADLAKLKSFRDSGMITQEQYEAVLDFIEAKKNGGGTVTPPDNPGVSGDTLMNDADVVSFLQMALMMNRITQEQYDRFITGKYTPEDLELLEGYYRTGIIEEEQYKSILAYIESRKNGTSTGQTQTVVSFTVVLSYTGQFTDMTTEAPESAPETTAPETGNAN